jgi:hypothetical protein
MMPDAKLFDFSADLKHELEKAFRVNDGANPSYSLHGRDSLAGMVQTSGIT